MAEAVRENAQAWDVVVLAGQTVLQYAQEARLAKHVVAEMVDDPCLETGRRLWKDLRPGVFLRRLQKLWGQPRYEQAFAGDVDVFTFVSEEDCESFRKRHLEARVEFVPNGVDVDYFERPADRPEPSGSPKVVFTGHMSHLPNEDAAEFLVRDIGPHLWRECNEVKIQLVGADPSEKVLSLASDRVEVTGKVPDIRPYLWDATVVAVPMRIGTGIKNKLLEAWAAGAPVVTTSMACQGLAAKAGKNVLVSDADRGFSQNVLSIIREDGVREQLRHGGVPSARKMSWRKMAGVLAEFVNESSTGERIEPDGTADALIKREVGKLGRKV